MAKSAHILVVDDESLNRKLLQKALENEGYTVEVAINGQSALNRLQEQPFDLVMLDIFLPDIFGDQLLKQIKANEHWQQIPVIIISATGYQEQIDRCLALGATSFLPKPFFVEQVYQSVSNALKEMPPPTP